MMRSSVRGLEPVVSVMHTRRRAMSVRRSRLSRRLAVAMLREAVHTSTMPGRTPLAAQSSSQLSCMGKTVWTSVCLSVSNMRSSMPREKSAATTLWPASPSGTARAPVPHPMSNTVSLGWISASSMKRRA